MRDATLHSEIEFESNGVVHGGTGFGGGCDQFTADYTIEDPLDLYPIFREYARPHEAEASQLARDLAAPFPARSVEPAAAVSTIHITGSPTSMPIIRPAPHPIVRRMRYRLHARSHPSSNAGSAYAASDSSACPGGIALVPHIWRTPQLQYPNATNGTASGVSASGAHA